MSKKQITLSTAVMSRIQHDHIVMKPRWYFIVGSLAMLLGLIGSTIISVFLVSIIAFSLRTHGPMGAIRFQQLLSSFPWWAPVLAIAGLVCGIWFLKHYDFSYRRNFSVIAGIFIAAIIFSGMVIDYYQLNEVWFRRGPIRGIMKQFLNDTGSESGYGRRQRFRYSP